MKYIKYKLGKGVFHLCNHKSTDYTGKAPCGIRPPTGIDICDCNNNWTTIRDTISDTPPAGRLCAKCKKIYLKTHTKEELFLEMM